MMIPKPPVAMQRQPVATKSPEKHTSKPRKENEKKETWPDNIEHRLNNIDGSRKKQGRNSFAKKKKKNDQRQNKNKHYIQTSSNQQPQTGQKDHRGINDSARTEKSCVLLVFTLGKRPETGSERELASKQAHAVHGRRQNSHCNKRVKVLSCLPWLFFPSIVKQRTTNFFCTTNLELLELLQRPFQD